MNKSKKTKKHILIDVKVHNHTDGDRLAFVYKNGDEKVYKIHKATVKTKGLRFINKEDSQGKREIYFLVEDEKQIRTKIDKKDYNFRKHIFLVVANFSKIKFSKMADFSRAEFSKEVVFIGVDFAKVAIFAWVKFLKEVGFFEVEFSKEAVFFGAEFSEKVTFFGKFSEKANFSGVKFFKIANFVGMIFSKIADFSGMVFYEKINFSGMVFYEKINFIGIVCRDEAFLDFHAATFHNKFSLQLEATKKQNLALDLSDIFLETKSFNYNNSLIESLDLRTNRETYSRLKDVALGRHDNITALELHKREYEVHRADLRKGKKKDSLDSLSKKFNLSDGLVLGFERYVSYFGTSIWRSITWWIGILLFTGVLILLIYKGGLSGFWGMFKSQQNVVIYAFRPVFLISNDNFLDNHSRLLILKLITFIKTVLLSVITYEIIKSFRKFSRKL